MYGINFAEFKRGLKAASIGVSKVWPIELDSIGVDFIFLDSAVSRYSTSNTT